MLDTRTRDASALKKVRWYNTLIVQSTGIIFFTALIVLISSVYFTYSFNLQSLESQFIQTESASFKNALDHIDEAILDHTLHLIDFSNSHISKHFITDTRDSNTSDAHPLLTVLEDFENLKGKQDVWKRIDLVDTSGKIHASTEIERIGSILSNEEETSANQKFTTIGTTKMYDLAEYQGIGKALLIVAEIRYWSSSDENSTEVVGYARGYLSPETVFEVTESFTNNDNSQEEKPFTIASKEGTVLFQTRGTISDAMRKEISALTTKGFPTSNIDITLKEVESATGTFSTYLVRATSEGYKEYEGFGWVGVAEIDTTPVRNALQATSFTHLKFYIPTILFATLILLGYIIYSFIFPLTIISKHFETNMGKVRIQPLTITGRGEIGKLAEGYNAFIAQIEERTKKLTETVEEVQALNNELESTKVATLNVLEDLDEEKRKVDETVTLRTQELVTERQKLMHITENMFVGVILIDETGKPVFVNQQAKTILDLGENISDAFTQLYKKFPSPLVRTLVETCLLGKSSIVEEIENEDGIFEIMGRCDSLKENTSQEFFGKGIWIRNITEEKQLERSKSELVAVASHQLRTPLTVTRGNLEMLLDDSFGKVNKKQRELLSDSEESVIRLIGMVNDMLDITKIEKGDKKLTLENFNILEPIETTVTSFETYTEHNKYTIDVTKPKKVIVVYGDKALLIQVFQNLIDNALKYGGKNKKVAISFQTRGTFVDISITDNGMGIPAKEQAVIFQRFYRASNAVRSTTGGSGLGLFIVKSFVEQMKGKISVTSTEGVGTTFVISLPLAK